MRITPAFVCCLFAFTSAAAGTEYKLVDLGEVNAGTNPWALNDRGQVVGSSHPKAFLYSRGRIRAIVPGNASSSEAFGINDKGEVVGSYVAGDTTHAFLYRRRGDIVDIGSLGGKVTVAVDINDKGQITGWARLPGPDVVIRAFLYDGGMKELDTFGGNTFATAINNRGHVVGYAYTAPDGTDSRAFLYRGRSLIDLGSLGGAASRAYDINDRGQIVGGTTTASGGGRAFLYERGKMRPLGDPSLTAQAFAINNHAQVVGTFDKTKGDARAFIHEHGRMRDLNQLIDEPSGWLLLEAWGINDRGQIAAYGCKTDVGCRALRLDPIRHGKHWDHDDQFDEHSDDD
jgi:probable HAF family extracellular repeat protein